MPINVPLIREDEEEGGYLEPMHPALANRTVNYYVCSRCWGDLRAEEAEGGTLVKCVSCGDETYGYVSRHWVEVKRTADLFDAKEVTRMLQRIGVLEKPVQKTEKQMMQELGH